MSNSDRQKELSMLEHKQRHRELHAALDELVADFIMHTEKYPSRTTIFELLKWSNEQKENPSVPNTRG